jgi:protein-disulfide isomerase
MTGVLLIVLNLEEAEAPTSSIAFDTVQSDGTFLGDPDAPVNFVIYSDYQCPFCKQFDDRDLPRLVETFVEPGDVRVEWRAMPVVSAFLNIPVDSDENESMQSAEAAMCAADQGAFWPYSEALFAMQGTENSGIYTPDLLKETASELELDAESFNRCLDSGAKEQEILAMSEDATRRGVTGTPSFLINDQLVAYTREGFDRLEEQIKQALEGNMVDT